MNIYKADEDCFFIELSKEDMESCSIKYNPSGLYTEKEENTFLHILEEYKEAFTFKKADIAILPGLRGGCIAVVKKKNEEVFPFSVFESEKLDNFIDAAKILHNNKTDITSSLYKGESCFRLITKNKPQKADLILREFSEKLPFSENEKKYTESYYECLIRDNALEVLCGK